MSAPQAYLLDIEGTTTPVTFVAETLFPFARKRLREFLEAHARDPQLEAQLQALEREHAHETAEKPPSWDSSDRISSACAHLEWLMDRDRKTTPLKALQGMIWEDGYRSGALVAPVYDDVPPAFKRWRAANHEIAIFSSGSVLAQKLLFAHTNAGNLTSFISAYFDTTTGPKKEPESYRTIAATMATPPQQVLFVSDISAELDAALAADMRTALCIRPGVAEPASGQHERVRSFAELELPSHSRE